MPKLPKVKVPTWLRTLFKGEGFENTLLRLGGADPAILRHAPRDRGEFRARGIAAIVPAILAVAGFTVGVDIAIGSLPVALLIGIVWGIIVLFLDVSLLTSLVGASWRRMVFMVLFRGIISLAAALAISSFILLGIFADDIAPQVAADQQTAAQANFKNVVEPKYAADKIKAQATLDKDQATLGQADEAVSLLQGQVAKTDQLVSCELNGANQTGTCPKTTGAVGNGPEAKADANQLRILQGQLGVAQAKAATLQQQLTPEMADARATLARIDQNAAADRQANSGPILTDNGLIPRWKALAEIRAESSSVDFWAWVIEILLIAADMMAVIAAVFSHTPAYNRVLRAMLAMTERQAVAEEATSAYKAAIAEAENATALQRRRWQLIDDSHEDGIKAAVAEAKLAERQAESRVRAADATRMAEAAEAERTAAARFYADPVSEGERALQRAKIRIGVARATLEAERAEAELRSEREFLRFNAQMPT